MIFTDCPGQDSALLTDDDFIVLNDETVQVKHRVHLQDRRKTFSMHTQLAAGQESEAAMAVGSHITPAEHTGLAVSCP